MPEGIVIFTGPTLPASEGRESLDALYLPPAGQGDIYKAFLKFSPRMIGLIDGYFENVPSVWHKEILYVMSQGVHVYGAASMGALRAAELDSFGMRGVGKIYEAYKNGILEDDDEVAIVHAPEELGYVGLSEAMVNIRETLSCACADGAISHEFMNETIRRAKILHYKNRSFASLLDTYTEEGVFEEDLLVFRASLPRFYRNLKKEDARLMLGTIKKEYSSRRKKFIPDFHFETTNMWLQCVRTANEHETAGG